MTGDELIEAWWLDYRDQEPYELGALLLTLLAFPELKETDEFSKVHSSMCARAIRQKVEDDPGYGFSYQRFRPQHISRADKIVQSDLRTFQRRLRDRMLAGRILNIKLSELAGKRLELPLPTQEPTIGNLINLTLDDLKTDDEEGIKTRVWRGSRPVIHLAGAVQAYLANLPEPLRPRAIGDLIFNPGAALFIVLLAKENEALIRVNSKRLDMEEAPAAMIKIRSDPPDKKIHFS